MSESSPSTSQARHRIDDFVPEEIWLNEEEDNTMPFPNEAESEMGLYDDVFATDGKRSGEKTEVEELQQQILHLKSQIAEKDSRINTLTQHCANLKRNICSLYKTSKTEIDHKDALLAEANAKLDELTFPRNVTLGRLEKPNPSDTPQRSFESNKVTPPKGDDPKEAGVSNKNASKSDKRPSDEPPAKRKRSSSPTTHTSNNKNRTKTKDNFHNKTQTGVSENASKSPNSGIQDKLKNTQNDSNPNCSKKIKTGDVKADVEKIKSSDIKENCDLKSKPSLESNEEPSIAEVFAKLQELAFTDPAATDVVFFNLLPPELGESFLEFGQEHTNALNKLKKSFVSCYFAQCRGQSSENEPHSSKSFFFQNISSQPQNESCSTSSTVCGSGSKNNSQIKESEGSNLENSGNISISTRHQNSSSQSKKDSCSSSPPAVHISDSKNKSQESISKVENNSDLPKPGKRSSSRLQDKSSLPKTESSESFSSKHTSDTKITPQRNTEAKKDSDSQRPIKNTITTSIKSSDSISKSQENLNKESEGTKDRDLNKSAKKSKKRLRSPKKASTSYKFKDDNLTLYTQRQLNRRRN